MNLRPKQIGAHETENIEEDIVATSAPDKVACWKWEVFLIDEARIFVSKYIVII